MGALVAISGSAAVISSDRPPSPAIARGITDLIVAFQIGGNQTEADRRRVPHLYAQAVTGYEEFVGVFVLWRACVRPPDSRFGPRPAQIEELCDATRNALYKAAVRACIYGERWWPHSSKLPDRWFGEYADAAPFTPGSLIPDEVAARWIRECLAREVDVDQLREVGDWRSEDYRRRYSYLPDCLRFSFCPSAIKKLPDAALPDGFREAYEGAVARLAQLRRQDDDEREAKRVGVCRRTAER